MPAARGTNFIYTIVEESTRGVTPTIEAGDTQIVPRSDGNVNASNTPLPSNNINSNRQQSAPLQGNQNVSGSLAADLAWGTFDLLWESMFRSKWSGNTLKVGDTETSFTMQVFHPDIGNGFVHKGLQVDTFDLGITQDGIVTCSFGLIGVDTVTVTTPIDSAPSSAPSSDAFYHVGGTFKEGNVVTGTIVGLSFNGANNMTSDHTLGNETPRYVNAGDFVGTGTVSVLFENMDMYNKFRDNTTTSLEAVLVDANNKSFGIKFPAVKLQGFEIPGGTKETIVVDIPFNYYFDAVSGTSIELTKSA